VDLDVFTTLLASRLRKTLDLRDAAVGALSGTVGSGDLKSASDASVQPGLVSIAFKRLCKPLGFLALLVGAGGREKAVRGKEA